MSKKSVEYATRGCRSLKSQVLSHQVTHGCITNRIKLVIKSEQIVPIIRDHHWHDPSAAQFTARLYITSAIAKVALDRLLRSRKSRSICLRKHCQLKTWKTPQSKAGWIQISKGFSEQLKSSKILKLSFQGTFLRKRTSKSLTTTGPLPKD